MSKAAYWQRGETLDYTNGTNAVIEANEVIVLENRIGVAGCEMKPGELGSVNVTGTYTFPKTGETAIKMGQAVYFDGNGITDSDEDTTPAGFAAADAAADATDILVKINA